MFVHKLLSDLTANVKLKDFVDLICSETTEHFKTMGAENTGPCSIVCGVAGSEASNVMKIVDSNFQISIYAKVIASAPIASYTMRISLKVQITLRALDASNYEVAQEIYHANVCPTSIALKAAKLEPDNEFEEISSYEALTDTEYNETFEHALEKLNHTLKLQEAYFKKYKAKRLSEQFIDRMTP